MSKSIRVDGVFGDKIKYGKRWIAVMMPHTPGEEYEQFVNLITNAPELLEMLEHITDELEGHIRSEYEGTRGLNPIHLIEINKARELIKKAKGG